MMSADAPNVRAELDMMQKRIRNDMMRAPKRKRKSPKSSSSSSSSKSSSKSSSSSSKNSSSSSSSRRKPTPFVAAPKRSEGAEKDRSLIRRMAQAVMPKAGGAAAPVAETGKAYGAKFVSSVVLAITMLALVVFTYLYLEANPKKCTKRQCTTISKLPENPLVVVAANLATNCSPKEKSKRAREIIEDTLEEITYG